jgi:hypothetical protein
MKNNKSFIFNLQIQKNMDNCKNIFTLYLKKLKKSSISNEYN